MKIINKIHKNKFKSIICDVEELYFFAKNAPLTDKFQDLVERLLGFVYSLDINNEVEHGQFIFSPATYSEDAMKIFNKIMSKKTGVKFKNKK